MLPDLICLLIKWQITVGVSVMIPKAHSPRAEFRKPNKALPVLETYSNHRIVFRKILAYNRNARLSSPLFTVSRP